MFNTDVKENSIKRLEASVEVFNNTLDRIKVESESLFKARIYASNELILSVEKYINQLANTPKNFDKDFAEIQQSYEKFNHYVIDLKNTDSLSNTKIGGATGAGVVVAAGVAALGPTAAIALATTFGTASTGTAIAALSGAAAANAALAWLGGGALAVGGGGMLAGKALLALAGPVGWGIGAIAVVGGGYWYRSKNAQLAEEATNRRIEIERYTHERSAVALEIRKITEITKSEISGIETLLQNLTRYPVTAYTSFDDEHKNQLLALINHTRALGVLLNKRPKAE